MFTTPVSYTHLDVYKRQEVNCVPLSVKMARGRPNSSQYVFILRNVVVVVALRRVNNLTYFVKLSTMTNKYLTPPVPVGRGP